MGAKAIHSFIIFVFLVRYLTQTEKTCSVQGSRGQKVSIDVETKEEGDGKWLTSFSALKNSSTLTKKLNVAVGHEIFDCDGLQVVHVHGYIKDAGDFSTNDADVTKDVDVTNDEDVTNDGLFFDRRVSQNAKLKNNQSTIEKINPDSQASALTNRPLKDNELFEVVVDRRKASPDFAMAIGVTLNSPSSITVPDHMNSAKNGTWMLYYNNLFYDHTIVNSNYLQSSLNVKTGGLVGVMRKSSGALHFYLDGVDKGPAASNIPMQVYGAVELWGAALQATISKPI